MNKKKWILVAIILFSVIVLGLATSYAIFVINVTKDTVFKVVIGNLELSITPPDTEDKIIMDKLVPTKDRDALKEEGYTFTITNTGTIDSYYTVYLDDLFLNKEELEELLDEPLTDEKTKRLEDNWVKINLLNHTTEKSMTKYMSDFKDSENRVLATGFLKQGESINYTLRIWIASEAGNEAEDRYYATQIRVVGQQENEYKDFPTIQVAGNGNQKLWEYKSEITKIIIQNELKPIEGENVESWDISTPDSKGTVMAYYDKNQKIAYIQGKNGIFANPNSSSLFDGFSKLTKIEGLELLDTSQVTDMGRMFYGCSSLTSLDLSNWDTSKVTNMSSMFQSCSLTSLNLSNWNTSEVTDIRQMFYSTGLVTLNLSGWDTSKVTTMQGLFNSSRNLANIIGIEDWNTSNVTDMSFMFCYCNSLTSLDLSNWNTSNVTTMRCMFLGTGLTRIGNIGNWDISNVTDMLQMFWNSGNLTGLNLNNWDTSNVTDMARIFYHCGQLTTTLPILVSDISDPTKYSGMFSGAATGENAQIVVNYTAENLDLVKKMIETKANESNKVVLGKQIDAHTVSIVENSDIGANKTASNYYPNVKVTLTSNSGATITSFEMNGKTITGNTFKMPNENVEITNVVAE